MSSGIRRQNNYNHLMAIAIVSSFAADRIREFAFAKFPSRCRNKLRQKGGK